MISLYVNMENLKKLFGEVKLSSNPFKQECITDITFWYRRKNCFGEVVNKFKATIDFENGSTTGSHEIEAKTFPELYEKVMDFCENL